MRRALLVGVVAAVAIGVGGSGIGIAAPAKAVPSRQELAQKILDSRAVMTASARMGLEALAHQDIRRAAPDSAQIEQHGKQLNSGQTDESQHGLANVRVNNPAEDVLIDQTTQSETTIAVSGRTVVVGFNDSARALPGPTVAALDLNGVAYSSDGGRTFTDAGFIPNSGGDFNLGDPWVAADANGTFYYSSLVGDYVHGGQFVGVSRSTSGGRTWSALAPLPTPPTTSPVYMADKDAMTAGPGTNVYATWDDFTYDPATLFPTFYSGLPVAHSSDGGQTWSTVYAARINMNPDASTGGCSFQQYIGAQPLRGPDGTLYLAAEKLMSVNPSCTFPPPSSQAVVAFASADGGQTWSAETTIAAVTSSTQSSTFAGFFQLGPGSFMRNLEFPTLAGRGHTVYATWNDGQGGHSHILMSSSSDRGSTWSNPTAVTAGNRDEIQPSITADAAGLHVLYYQISTDTSGKGALNAMVSDSPDGTTWTARRVTDRSFPGVLNVPQFDPIIVPGYMGDYIASATDGSARYFAWGDNRDIVVNALWPQGRNDPNVYFAKDVSGDSNQQH
ncbi:MAG TPA: sialidase family protein [Candidatus Limnocylindrales bacterium]|nr:sialidase family protein [Candidatus Limnocylindrales bacterium]